METPLYMGRWETLGYTGCDTAQFTTSEDLDRKPHLNPYLNFLLPFLLSFLRKKEDRVSPITEEDHKFLFRSG